MTTPLHPDDFDAASFPCDDSEEKFLEAWNMSMVGRRQAPKKIPPETLIAAQDRDLSGYDLWSDLLLKREFARPFEGRLPMQVPGGRFICKPIIAQLQKVAEAKGLIPYFCLAMVVAVGPHKGKIVPWYWRYPGDRDDDFWRDCRNAGIHPDHMDLGCGFTGGGLHVVVRDVQRGKYSFRQVSSVTKLTGLFPEEIWPSEADKPSVKQRAALAAARAAAVAAAASLNAAGAGHEQHGASRVNANVPPAAP